MVDNAFLNFLSQVSRAGATRERIDCVLLVAHAVRAHRRIRISAGCGRIMLGVTHSRNGSDCGFGERINVGKRRLSRRSQTE
jgi:hypothetical protein